ncbi:GntR family transcriptional regulator [Actinosynnema pretiosum]|uniref:GntR family transcriptional regulator n=1 Tax=Actinosynnema pretiosum TaxID=42197 RepID=A0A290Z3S3_9PSEU|nr:GntR family transcriptional regulator [Actinosynnema pretiosum]ATE53619.1 GntR family transcriptional regulator [Actinosynnema pretiosum]
MPRRADSRPLHQQVAAALRAQIMSGDLAPGARLPSTSQLVETFGAANPTIQKAQAQLKDEGYLRSQPGKGVYVREREPFVVEAGNYFAPSPRGYAYQLLDVAEVVPPADVATALGLTEGERAVLRQRLMTRDGEPVELSYSYYPAHLAAGTPLAGRGKIRGGAPQVLAELGCPQREFADRLSARQPTTEEVELLDLPAEVPVIRQFRTIRTYGDRPVEVTVMVKGGHLYELLYRVEVSEG